jgi:hypothetical protein
MKQFWTFDGSTEFILSTVDGLTTGFGFSIGGKPMNKKISTFLLAIVLLAAVPLAEAQQAKVYRVGVILHGGPLYQAVDGLREGLKESR